MKWPLYVIILGGVILSFLVLSYLSSKNFDMNHYLNRVKYCCAFPDALSTGYTNMFHISYYMNEVLSKEYMLIEGYGPDYIKYYKEYREWLLMNYLDPNIRFSRAFPNLFARSWKKQTNAAEFKKVFSGVSEELLFFAQSFYRFSKSDFEHRSVYEITTVECQMRLAATNMMKLIDARGYNYDYEIADIEELYKQAQNNDREKNRLSGKT